MQSANNNKLKGKFIECCDCYTICPCWVKDRPDEDHCSSLYIWTFDEDAEIKGNKIGGYSVAAASFHWGDSQRQAAIYVDNKLDKSTRELLLDAFSGKDENFTSLKSLSQLLGTVVDSSPATINLKDCKGGKWEVTVTVDGSPNPLAHATWEDDQVDGQPAPVTLNDTALHKELGIQGVVTVQKVERFEMAVSPLPGGPFVYSGRSGMAAKFDYTGRS